MPIAPEFRHMYGHRWRTVIRPAVLKRCQGRCERCRRIPLRIEVAHLDQDPYNIAENNLAALCGRCHRRHDYVIWAAKALETRRVRKDRGRPLLGEIGEG
jgi:hypothetical protein